MSPVNYKSLTPNERRLIRSQYIEDQQGLWFYCKQPLLDAPPSYITDKSIDWTLFPINFLYHPIHLQHDHNTGLTEGAVHAYCNAVMWQYEHR